MKKHNLTALVALIFIATAGYGSSTEFTMDLSNSIGTGTGAEQSIPTHGGAGGGTAAATSAFSNSTPASTTPTPTSSFDKGVKELQKLFPEGKIKRSYHRTKVNIPFPETVTTVDFMVTNTHIDAIVLKTVQIRGNRDTCPLNASPNDFSVFYINDKGKIRTLFLKSFFPTLASGLNFSGSSAAQIARLRALGSIDPSAPHDSLSDLEKTRIILTPPDKSSGMKTFRILSLTFFDELAAMKGLRDRDFLKFFKSRSLPYNVVSATEGDVLFRLYDDGFRIVEAPTRAIDLDGFWRKTPEESLLERFWYEKTPARSEDLLPTPESLGSWMMFFQ